MSDILDVYIADMADRTPPVGAFWCTPTTRQANLKMCEREILNGGAYIIARFWMPRNQTPEKEEVLALIRLWAAKFNIELPHKVTVQVRP